MTITKRKLPTKVKETKAPVAKAAKKVDLKTLIGYNLIELATLTGIVVVVHVVLDLAIRVLG